MLAMFASDVVDVTAGLGTGLADDPVGAARRAVVEAAGKTDREPRLCITTPGTNTDPLRVLEGLRAELGDGVPILGGVSSASLDDPGSALQFFDDQIVHDGVTVLLFSGPLASRSASTTGGDPWGVRRPSPTSPKVVDEIDGRAGDRLLRALPGRRHGSRRPRTRSRCSTATPTTSTSAWRSAPTPMTGADRGGRRRHRWAPACGSPSPSPTTSSTGRGRRCGRRWRGIPRRTAPEAALVFSCADPQAVLGTRTGTELDITRRRARSTRPRSAGSTASGRSRRSDTGATRFHNETIVTVLLGEAA